MSRPGDNILGLVGRGSQKQNAQLRQADSVRLIHRHRASVGGQMLGQHSTEELFGSRHAADHAGTLGVREDLSALSQVRTAW